MSQPVLDISGLNVHFTTQDGDVHAVRGVDCTINRGECLGVVGESGSGKSQTFLAAMGLLSSNGRTTGTITFEGEDLLAMNLDQLNLIRGKKIAMIFQDPLTSLTPHLRIGEQMGEVLRLHLGLTGSAANKRAIEWLDRVQIPEAGRRIGQYPHELSGGMRQRVMIAMAMLCQPDLLIADEPTTALDVTIQAEILDLMDELRRDHGTSIALVTHDMGVVARMCDRIQVMRDGAYVEHGTAEEIFYRPQSDYTKMLLDAVPRFELDHGAPPARNAPDGTAKKANGSASEGDDFLAVEDVRVEFNIPMGFLARPAKLRAVDGISFQLGPGETLGVVGESGSGKSTLARAILQLIPPTDGVVTWLGQPLNKLSQEAIKSERQNLQIVFQDPLASLDPSMTIGTSMAEPLRVFRPDMGHTEREMQVRVMMERVGLDPNMINRYPHELSGGQNQRVGIARAIMLNPKLVICDEPVSALDVSIQAQILDLLRDLQQEFGLSYIFISHDLSVVWEIAHRVLVMYLGSVVEMAGRDALFRTPMHPYTKQLISAVPIPDPKIERGRQRIRLKGRLASPLDPKSRLRFVPSRVGQVADDYVPGLEERAPDHFVAEHDPIETLLADTNE